MNRKRSFHVSEGNNRGFGRNRRLGKHCHAGCVAADLIGENQENVSSNWCRAFYLDVHSVAARAPGRILNYWNPCRSLKKLRRESTIHPVASTSRMEVRHKSGGGIDDAILDTDRCTSSRPRSTQEPAGSAYQQHVQHAQHVQHVAPSISASSHAEWHHDRRTKVSDGDPKIHVGGGNVMSYRWITRTVSNVNHGGTVLEAMEGLTTSREAMGLGVIRRESFILIVMPDLFMTIDYMEKWLGGLLQHNPRGRLLLVRTYCIFNQL